MPRVTFFFFFNLNRSDANGPPAVFCCGCRPMSWYFTAQRIEPDRYGGHVPIAGPSNDATQQTTTVFPRGPQSMTDLLDIFERFFFSSLAACTGSFIAMFRFCIILGVMETQLQNEEEVPSYQA